MKHVPDILRTGVRFDGLDTFGDANRQHAALLERLTPPWVIEAQITRDRVDMALWSCLDVLGSGEVAVADQEHIAGIARLPLGTRLAKMKPVAGSETIPGFRQTRRAIALAFDNGSTSGIVGIDQFTVAELLALGEPRGLPADVLMGAHRRAQLMGKTRALRLTQRLCLFKTLLGLLSEGFDGLAKFQELLFGLANQLDKDMRLAPAAAAKAPHDFFDLLLEALGLLLELGRPAAALLSDVLDEF
jgi:hypothetical protein